MVLKYLKKNTHTKAKPGAKREKNAQQINQLALPKTSSSNRRVEEDAQDNNPETTTPNP